MATFAIGDVQGCRRELERLLERVRFDPADDRLWFTGDLVNRGPDSLDTLRFVRELGDAAVTVLGNHDLHLLALASGADSAPAPDASLEPILRAKDRDRLMDWLRRRPLLHHDAELGYTLVHAGIPPQWSITEAAKRAEELESVLGGPDWRAFMARMYGNEPARWSDGLQGADRLRYIVNAFTRMRFVDPETGDLDVEHKGPPGSQPDRLVPWFRVPGRRTGDAHILFGHWSTLGDVCGDGVYPLDTGCLWGGKLTALRLDGEGEGGWFTVDCPPARDPGGGHS